MIVKEGEGVHELPESLPGSPWTPESPRSSCNRSFQHVFDYYTLHCIVDGLIFPKEWKLSKNRLTNLCKNISSNTLLRNSYWNECSQGMENGKHCKCLWTISTFCNVKHVCLFLQFLMNYIFKSFWPNTCNMYGDRWKKYKIVVFRCLEITRNNSNILHMSVAWTSIFSSFIIYY